MPRLFSPAADAGAAGSSPAGTGVAGGTDDMIRGVADSNACAVGVAPGSGGRNSVWIVPRTGGDDAADLGVAEALGEAAGVAVARGEAAGGTTGVSAAVGVAAWGAVPP